MSDLISLKEFEKVDIRVGRIIEVTDFERAKFPTYKFKIDFGKEIGIKQSCGRFKSDYTPDKLLSKQCLAVVNFPPKNIAGFESQVLVLGVSKPDGGIALLRPVDEAELGARIY